MPVAEARGPVGAVPGQGVPVAEDRAARARSASARRRRSSAPSARYAPPCPSARAARPGTRPNCALIPDTPANAHGMRIEPPPSVPTASWPRPAASCADAPPLEPPGVRSRFHGLRVMPVSALSVTPFQPYSGVQVLPSSTAPALAQARGRGRVVVPRAGRVDRLRAAQRRPALREHEILDRGRHAVDRRRRARPSPSAPPTRARRRARLPRRRGNRR